MHTGTPQIQDNLSLNGDFYFIGRILALMVNFEQANPILAFSPMI